MMSDGAEEDARQLAFRLWKTSRRHIAPYVVDFLGLTWKIDGITMWTLVDALAVSVMKKHVRKMHIHSSKPDQIISIPASITDLVKLEHLEIQDVAADLTHVWDLTKLICLKVSVDDAAVIDVSGVLRLKSLKELALSAYRIDGLAYVSLLTQLEKLCLSETESVYEGHVDFDALISPLVNLRALELAHIEYEDGGTRWCSTLTRLEQLTLTSCYMEDEFKLMTSLKSLHLIGTDVAFEFGPFHLTRLVCKENEIGSMDSLACLLHLQDLELDDVMMDFDADETHVLSSLKSLTRLHIKKYEINIASLNFTKNLKNLKDLRVEWNGLQLALNTCLP